MASNLKLVIVRGENMFRLILLKLLLVSSLCAVGSDFYDGLAGGELIGDLNAPDSFGEVSNSDLAGWSTQEYGDVASNGSGGIKPVDPRMRGLQVTLDELDHGHGIDHTYKHLQVCDSKKMNARMLRKCFKQSIQIFDHNPNTRQARQATIDLAEEIMKNPIEVKSGLIAKTDGMPYTGYLGRYNGRLIEVRIAEVAKGGKDLPGKLKTIVGVSENVWIKKYPKSYNMFLSQVRRAPRLPKTNTATNIPTRTPRAPRVTGAGKVAGFVGGLAIDCTVGAVTAKVTEGDAALGCVDGVAGTEPFGDGTETGQEELDLGAALRVGKINNPPHPDHKLIDQAGKGLLDSRVNFRTSKILDGPYQGKCIAVKSGYTVAVECGSLAGHEKVGHGPELVILNKTMGNGMYFPF